MFSLHHHGKKVIRGRDDGQDAWVLGYFDFGGPVKSSTWIIMSSRQNP